MAHYFVTELIGRQSRYISGVQGPRQPGTDNCNQVFGAIMPKPANDVGDFADGRDVSGLNISEPSGGKFIKCGNKFCHHVIYIGKC